MILKSLVEFSDKKLFKFKYNFVRCVTQHLNMLRQSRQEGRAIARKPRDAAAVRCGLKFADIH